MDLLAFLQQDANNNQQRKYLMPRKGNESEKYHIVRTFQTLTFSGHKMRIKCDVFLKLGRDIENPNVLYLDVCFRFHVTAKFANLFLSLISI